MNNRQEWMRQAKINAQPKKEEKTPIKFSSPEDARKIFSMMYTIEPNISKKLNS